MKMRMDRVCWIGMVGRAIFFLSACSFFLLSVGCPAKERPLKDLPEANISKKNHNIQARQVSKNKSKAKVLSKRRIPISRRAKLIIRNAPPKIPKGAIRRGHRGFRGGVFHEKSQVPNPLAVRLCQALHLLPKQRRMTCCKDKFMLFHPAKECIRTLTASLKSGHIRLSAKKVEGCEISLKKLYTGCEWIGFWGPRVPDACLGIFEGTRKKGFSCRSALECPKGMYCHGLGSTTAGRCWTRLPEGLPCGRGIDPLAVYTRQDNLGVNHPQCQGYCVRTRCRNAIKIGGSCQADMHCGAGNHCANGKCTKGWFAKKGARCDSWCESGSRCFKGQCITPKGAGQPCRDDGECGGGCFKKKGQKIGICQMQCSLIRR